MATFTLLVKTPTCQRFILAGLTGTRHRQALYFKELGGGQYAAVEVMRWRLLLGSVPLTCLALAGCASTGTQEGTDPSLAVQRPPSSIPDSKVDDVTRGILMAAGLDPADPAKPREIRRQVAAVVKIRHRGRTYGTALARPTPGKFAFVDPMAVANLLGDGTNSKTELAKALKGEIIDVASRDCRVNGRADRKWRKALKIPKVCPTAAGSIWADFDRRGMTVELHMEPQLAALVQSVPPAPTELAAPTLLMAGDTTASTTVDSEPVVAPAEHVRTSRAGVNLLSPESILAVAQPEQAKTAGAPISLAAPVVLPPLPNPAAGTATAATETTPWAPLLAPVSLSTTRLGAAAVSPAPSAAAPSDVSPTVAVMANPGAMQPVALPRGGISETDDSYRPSPLSSTIRVVSGSYSPLGTTRFFRTKY